MRFNVLRRPAQRRLSTASSLLALALALSLVVAGAAIADNLEVDSDGLVPVAQGQTTMNFGSICVGQSASDDALLAIRRTGSGTNVYANNAVVTVSAAAPTGDPTVSTSFTDNSITLPAGWSGVTNNTMSSDTATSVVTVTGVGNGAKSAAVVYTATAGIARTATLTINWTVITCDGSPPVIEPNVSGTVGNNGWYTSDVNVSWTVTDAESAISSSTGCGPTTINADTAGQTLTCSATSTGGTNSQSVTVKRDATAPTASASASPAPNGAGWNNADVTVSFSGSDATSGIASCTVDAILSTEGAGQSASGTCTDNAGNTSAPATASGISIDKTPPTAAPTVAPAANGAGWNNTDVTVSFSGGDALSGIASCTTNAVLSTEGAGQSASGTCTDNAGNTSAPATASGINIDKTAPSVTASASPPANGAGWNDGAVTVSFSGTDGGSGIGACDSPVTLPGDGLGQSATGSCTDKAGNSASSSASGINIDSAPPTISGSATPAANINGWNNTDVAVAFTCGDALSGVASCGPDTSLTGEGAGQSVSGTAVDNAGNSAVTSVTGINIDKTAPSVTAMASPAANGAGWNNTAVTVSFSGTDAGSGIDTCSPSAVLSSDGAGQFATGSCTDEAGNSASASASGINVDTTAPTISGSRSPGANANGWNNTDVTVSFICDDTLSGVANCGPNVTLSGEGANQSAAGTAIDNADNSASATVAGISIDKTPPTAAPTVAPAANGNGWNNTGVTVTWNWTDTGGSGTDACPVSSTTTGEGNAIMLSATCTDKAGNSTAVSRTLKVDATSPTISGSRSPGANANGWNNTDVTVSFICDDTLSGVANCGPNVTLSGEGANQSAAGTAIDNADNSASATVAGINIDKTPPVVSVTGVTQGGSYTLGSVPTAGCSTVDNLSGVATPASLTTSGGPVGSFTATCSGAVDNAGNTGSASVTYQVIYNWDGFFQPVENPGANMVFNRVKAGSAIPLKFKLGGNQGLDIMAAGYPLSQTASCSMATLTDDLTETVNAGGSSLSYDADSGQYNYVWKTDKAWAGKCRKLTVRLADGTDHIAFFTFTK